MAKKTVANPVRNERFAEALDELRRRGVVKNQKDLAVKMKMTPTAVSRIMLMQADVTEEAVTRLQTASGGIFNLQWLRGTSSIKLTTETTPGTADPDGNTKDPVLAAKDGVIQALRAEITAKDMLVRTLQSYIADLRSLAGLYNVTAAGEGHMVADNRTSGDKDSDGIA